MLHAPTSRLLLSLTLVTLSLATPSQSAEAPFGQPLLRPDSLVGWTYAQSPPTGWTIDDGRLAGTADASPLLSGYTFGPFELRLRFTVDADGQCALRLPDVPDGPGLTLLLEAGEACGRLLDGQKQIAGGAALAEAKDGDQSSADHTLVLRRDGATLSLAIDGEQRWQIDVPVKRRFGLGLEVRRGSVSLAELRVAEPPGKPIFNGRDLSGWWTPGKIDKWRVEDNQIVRTERAGDYLRTERDWGNFTFSFEYRMKPGTNAGLSLRTPREGWPSTDGMELQMLDRKGALEKDSQMALYGAVPPLARAIRSGEWNRVVVKADGRIITAWENGQLVQHYNTRFHPELRHRLLRGWLGFQDHGNWLRLRDLRVLEAPDGEGLSAWYDDPPSSAPARLIDRVMNPWLLAERDGGQSHRVRADVAGDQPSEHVLADLEGPGVVTRIVRQGEKGTLDFFLDGEPEPRVSCPAAQLHKSLPMLSEHPRPILTCLPFAKRLKIVLRDARKASYQIDYVTFPEAYLVESFQPSRAVLPRGWRDSVIYRQLKYKWNCYRNLRRSPRPSATARQIAPGATGAELTIDGAGIIRYVKLRAPKSAYTDNRLRLEVLVDGEDESALAAPVRMLLPTLVAGSHREELVHFQRDGRATTQAMPFGRGITLRLRNAGREAIGPVALEVDLERATDANRQEIARMMRLRGTFLPAGTKPTLLADYRGRGRLVALIVDSRVAGTDPQADNSPSPPIAAAGLIIDGQGSDIWNAPNLDILLGHGGPFAGSLSGRGGSLAWRYFWYAPPDFRQSLQITAPDAPPCHRLALFYATPES